MLTEAAHPLMHRTYDLSDDLLHVARSNASGIAACGREAEIHALRTVGRRDASLGRIYEGHVNAAQLVARYGTPAQHERHDRGILNGRLSGVWNTQDANGVRIHPAGDHFVLSGAKTWASGAGSIASALVSAVWPDGTLQLCLVPMDDAAIEIDSSRWKPLGMERSDSFEVSFDGVSLTTDDLIGKPGDYERQPWFFGGALRFLAVQTGVVERLATETARYLYERNRHTDVSQQIRVAQMRIATHTCSAWLDAGIKAWMRYDACDSAANADRIIEVVDMARIVVERAASETIEATLQSVGARGLLEPHPFAAVVRDLQMYLRQPAPDAALLRAAAAAFRDAAAIRGAEMGASGDPASDVTVE